MVRSMCFKLTALESVSVTHAARTLLSPTTQILTFTATADGTCHGQDVNSVVWVHRYMLSAAILGNGPLASMYPHSERVPRCLRVCSAPGAEMV
jgi:hypothetical protein